MPDGDADLRLTAKTTPTSLYASVFGRLTIVERQGLLLRSLFVLCMQNPRVVGPR